MCSGSYQDFSGSFMASESNGLYEFGPFRLDPVQRLLTRDDCQIPLQPKAFETLLVRNSEKAGFKG
jgi:DNA-binding winged helix-turn-helix (wHTH) protein